jgi:hypothetical protein
LPLLTMTMLPVPVSGPEPSSICASMPESSTV